MNTHVSWFIFQKKKEKRKLKDMNITKQLKGEWEAKIKLEDEKTNLTYN